ncbi:MAG TPA: FAD-dependent oxidoreductase [Thermaerobacter sp.]
MPGDPATVIVVGGGITGTAIAHALQGPCQVILIDDAEFPGLAETRTALGVIRAAYGREPLDRYARRTWEFALAQHENPRSPLRLRLATLDGWPARAAFLDHLLLLDAFLLLARRAGCQLRAGWQVTELILAGGRVRGVRAAPAGRGGTGEVIHAEAVVLAPGPRPDTLSLEGLPDGFAQHFQRIKDIIIPFRLPASGDTGRVATRREEPRQVAPGRTDPAELEAAVITRRSLIWTFITGLEAHTLHAVARLAGDWSPPSFEQAVAMVEDLYERFQLPGEAELERIRTCIDLAGPAAAPFAGPVAPLGGAEGLFVAAGMGLEGLSLCAGVAGVIARAVLAYLE